MSRSDVLRKCIVVFDAIKRAASKGNAGLEPERGKEESFETDCEICNTLREMLQEMETTDKPEQIRKEINKDLNEWQDKIVKFGAPERLDFYERERQ